MVYKQIDVNGYKVRIISLKLTVQELIYKTKSFALKFYILLMRFFRKIMYHNRIKVELRFLTLIRCQLLQKVSLDEELICHDPRIQNVSVVIEQLPDVLRRAVEYLSGQVHFHLKHPDVQLVPGNCLQHGELGPLDVQDHVVHCGVA